MADSSRVQLAYVKESTLGVTPASALKALRYTRETLGRRFESVQSDEVREDRQVVDITRVGANAQGGIEIEISHTTYNEFLEAALGNLMSAPVEVIATDIAANGGGTQTLTRPASMPIYQVGQFVWVSGFSNAANNGYFEVETSSGTTLKLKNGRVALVNESAGQSVKISASSIVNGSTPMSFTIEKKFADLNGGSGIFYPFTGMRLNTFEMRIASRAKVTGSMDFFGGGGRLLTATVGTGAYTAATTTSTLNASNNVGQVLENGSSLGAGAFVKQMTIRIANNLRPQDAVGSVNPIGIGYGSLVITGTMQIYFVSEALFNRFLDDIDSSFALVIGSGGTENDAYAITMPKIEFTNGDVLGTGNNDDVLCNMEYQAKLSPTHGYSMRIDSFS
jgi:hypothetical protein